LKRRKAVREERILWSPQRKQAEALKNSAFELLYGGAAGGGKTDFLLVDYIGFVNEWRQHWRGILFRQTYPELDAIIQRAQELYLPLGAVWNRSAKVFTFPTGSVLYLRFLENENDVIRYQGQSYTWAGFDEAGNYPTDYVWKYMISRLRSAAGAPCYIRGTANPGGRGHMWLKTRFIDGREPGKIYRVPINQRGHYTTRCFIPSRVTDNRALLDHDPGYVTRLELLPHYLRRALLEGDWDIFAGQVFDEFRRDLHVVKPCALPAEEWYRFYALDWGYAAPYAIVKVAVNRYGRMVQYGEIYGCETGEANKGARKGASVAAAEAWADAVKEGVTVMVADPANWNKVDHHPAPAEYFEQAGFFMERGNHDRVPGWLAIHERLNQRDGQGRPMLQFFETCPHTIRTLPALTPDRNHPEDVDSKLEDHLADALRYAVMSDYAINPRSVFRRRHYAEAKPARYKVLEYNNF
jgi:hypothetical protein